MIPIVNPTKENSTKLSRTVSWHGMPNIVVDPQRVDALSVGRGSGAGAVARWRVEKERGRGDEALARGIGSEAWLNGGRHGRKRRRRATRKMRREDNMRMGPRLEKQCNFPAV